MTVSIIIPVYNVEQHIEECLQSVAKQIFRGGLECIIVDDGCTDASMSIVERFVQNYEGNISFCIIHHDYNKGVSAARNTGIAAASFEYVYFLDSDDWINPDCIDLLAECAMKYPRVDLVQGSVHNAPRNLKISPDIQEYYDDRKEIAHFLLSGGMIPITVWNKLISNNFLKRNKKVRFMEGVFHEEVLFSYYLAQFVTSFAVVHVGTYHYRECRAGSITSRGEQHYWLVQQLKECLKDLPSTNKDIYLHWLFGNLLYLMSFQMTNVDANDVKDIYQALMSESRLLNKTLLLSLRFVPKRIRRIKMIYNTYLRLSLRCFETQQ